MKKLLALAALFAALGAPAMAGWYFDAGIGFSRESYGSRSRAEFAAGATAAFSPWGPAVYLGCGMGLHRWDQRWHFEIAPLAIMFPWDFLSLSAGVQFMLGGRRADIHTMAGLMKHFRVAGPFAIGVGASRTANVGGFRYGDTSLRVRLAMRRDRSAEGE